MSKMKPETRKKLEKAGWKVGDSREFLGLTKSETALVEVKLVLARNVRGVPKKHR